jgi:hypothetical protein
MLLQYCEFAWSPGHPVRHTLRHRRTDALNLLRPAEISCAAQLPLLLSMLMADRLHWVYAYLFAKKDRANLDDDELASFRALTTLHARKSDADIAKEVQFKELVEICHDESQIQE